MTSNFRDTNSTYDVSAIAGDLLSLGKLPTIESIIAQGEDRLDSLQQQRHDMLQIDYRPSSQDVASLIDGLLRGIEVQKYRYIFAISRKISKRKSELEWLRSSAADHGYNRDFIATATQMRHRIIDRLSDKLINLGEVQLDSQTMEELQAVDEKVSLKDLDQELKLMQQELSELNLKSQFDYKDAIAQNYQDFTKVNNAIATVENVKRDRIRYQDLKRSFDKMQRLQKAAELKNESQLRSDFSRVDRAVLSAKEAFEDAKSKFAKAYRLYKNFPQEKKADYERAVYSIQAKYQKSHRAFLHSQAMASYIKKSTDALNSKGDRAGKSNIKKLRLCQDLLRSEIVYLTSLSSASSDILDSGSEKQFVTKIKDLQEVLGRVDRAVSAANSSRSDFVARRSVSKPGFRIKDLERESQEAVKYGRSASQEFEKDINSYILKEWDASQLREREAKKAQSVEKIAQIAQIASELYPIMDDIYHKYGHISLVNKNSDKSGRNCFDIDIVMSELTSDMEFIEHDRTLRVVALEDGGYDLLLEGDDGKFHSPLSQVGTLKSTALSQIYQNCKNHHDRNRHVRPILTTHDEFDGQILAIGDDQKGYIDVNGQINIPLKVAFDQGISADAARQKKEILGQDLWSQARRFKAGDSGKKSYFTTSRTEKNIIAEEESEDVVKEIVESAAGSTDQLRVVSELMQTVRDSVSEHFEVAARVDPNHILAFLRQDNVSDSVDLEDVIKTIAENSFWASGRIDQELSADIFGSLSNIAGSLSDSISDSFQKALTQSFRKSIITSDAEVATKVNDATEVIVRDLIAQKDQSPQMMRNLSAIFELVPSSDDYGPLRHSLYGAVFEQLKDIDATNPFSEDRKIFTALVFKLIAAPICAQDCRSGRSSIARNNITADLVALCEQNGVTQLSDLCLVFQDAADFKNDDLSQDLVDRFNVNIVTAFKELAAAMPKHVDFDADYKSNKSSNYYSEGEIASLVSFASKVSLALPEEKVKVAQDLMQQAQSIQKSWKASQNDMVSFAQIKKDIGRLVDIKQISGSDGKVIYSQDTVTGAGDLIKNSFNYFFNQDGDDHLRLFVASLVISPDDSNSSREAIESILDRLATTDNSNRLQNLNSYLAFLKVLCQSNYVEGSLKEVSDELAISSPQNMVGSIEISRDSVTLQTDADIEYRSGRGPVANSKASRSAKIAFDSNCQVVIKDQISDFRALSNLSQASCDKAARFIANSYNPGLDIIFSEVDQVMRDFDRATESFSVDHRGDAADVLSGIMPTISQLADTDRNKMKFVAAVIRTAIMYSKSSPDNYDAVIFANRLRDSGMKDLGNLVEILHLDSVIANQDSDEQARQGCRIRLQQMDRDAALQSAFQAISHTLEDHLAIGPDTVYNRLLHNNDTIYLNAVGLNMYLNLKPDSRSAAQILGIIDSIQSQFDNSKQNLLCLKQAIVDSPRSRVSVIYDKDDNIIYTQEQGKYAFIANVLYHYLGSDADDFLQIAELTKFKSGESKDMEIALTSLIEALNQKRNSDDVSEGLRQKIDRYFVFLRGSCQANQDFATNYLLGSRAFNNTSIPLAQPDSHIFIKDDAIEYQTTGVLGYFSDNSDYRFSCMGATSLSVKYDSNCKFESQRCHYNVKKSSESIDFLMAQDLYLSNATIYSLSNELMSVMVNPVDNKSLQDMMASDNAVQGLEVSNNKVTKLAIAIDDQGNQAHFNISRNANGEMLRVLCDGNIYDEMGACTNQELNSDHYKKLFATFAKVHQHSAKKPIMASFSELQSVRFGKKSKIGTMQEGGYRSIGRLKSGKSLYLDKNGMLFLSQSSMFGSFKYVAINAPADHQIDKLSALEIESQQFQRFSARHCDLSKQRFTGRAKTFSVEVKQIGIYRNAKNEEVQIYQDQQGRRFKSVAGSKSLQEIVDLSQARYSEFASHVDRFNLKADIHKAFRFFGNDSSEEVSSKYGSLKTTPASELGVIFYNITIDGQEQKSFNIDKFGSVYQTGPTRGRLQKFSLSQLEERDRKSISLVVNDCVAQKKLSTMYQMFEDCGYILDSEQGFKFQKENIEYSLVKDSNGHCQIRCLDVAASVLSAPLSGNMADVMETLRDVDFTDSCGLITDLNEIELVIAERIAVLESELQNEFSETQVQVAKIDLESKISRDSIFEEAAVRLFATSGIKEQKILVKSVLKFLDGKSIDNKYILSHSEETKEHAVEDARHIADNCIAVINLAKAIGVCEDGAISSNIHDHGRHEELTDTAISLLGDIKESLGIAKESQDEFLAQKIRDYANRRFNAPSPNPSQAQAKALNPHAHEDTDDMSHV